MAVFLRALVMLVVLVGLPAAWVYYGPLPPRAQTVVDRVVNVARETLGWEQLQQDPTINCGVNIEPDVKYFDPAVKQASAIIPREIVAPPAQQQEAPPVQQQKVVPEVVATAPVPSLQDQVAPLLEQLRAQGASQYTLEKWGREGQLYRFRCTVPLDGSDQLTQQFEAIHQQPKESIAQVLGEVSSWQVARASRTQLR